MLRFAALAIACLAAAPALADWDKAKLDREIAGIERDSKGRLGVALIDLKDRTAWSHRGSEHFPLQSVFKLPLAVAVLQAVEAGTLRLDQPVTVTRKDLSLYHSPLATRFKGERQEVPLRELVRLAAAESDNTAADLLTRLIGRPSGASGWRRRCRTGATPRRPTPPSPSSKPSRKGTGCASRSTAG